MRTPIPAFILLFALAPPAFAAPALTHPADRRAFLLWFTYLAESVYFRPASPSLAEVQDCAALARFAYRESLARHDGDWARRLGLPTPPTYPSVRTSEHSSIGVFRGNSGEFRHFADAGTLRRRNAFFLSRDLAAARPGDLLFFHQPGQDFPFHLMIYLGPSHFEKSSARDWVVYHTGPIGSTPGEVRRLRLADLLQHREPRWRPQVGNPRFLGVYRWNILRAGDPNP